MTFKKFITYQCNICKRTKDMPTDKLHGFINLCTITQNCGGRLKPIATKNLREILPSSSEANLVNWKPRTQQEAAIQLQEEPVVHLNLASSSAKVLTMAVKGDPNLLPLNIDLKFSIELADSQSYLEYTYTLAAGIDTIIGTDNSSLGKLLRFTNNDVVMVYINGVLLSTSDFTLNYQGSTGYSVTLHTIKNVQTSAKVVVFQNVPIAETSALTFSKNSNLDISSAWENVNSVLINGEQWTVYSCVDISALPINSILTLYEGSSFSQTLPNTPLDQLRFLAAYDPFTVVDRIYNAVVSLANLSAENQYIRVYSHAGLVQLQTTNKTIDMLEIIRVDEVNDVSKELVTSLINSTLEPTLFPTNSSVIGPV